MQSLVGKTNIAIALGILAMLSYFYAASVDRPSEELAGIPMAIAKDDRVSGNLEMFLKIDGIPGNAADSTGKHKGEIDVDSYAWDVSRGGGKPSMNVFRVTMPAGRASSKLFLNTAGGVKISRVALGVRKQGANGDFLTWILTDVNISSFKTVGNTHGDGVMEEVSFSFGKIETSYSPPEGGAPLQAGWDQRTGKSVGY